MPLLEDLRYSLRRIARSPVFSVSAILLMAAGVAANTEVFTLVDAVLLRPLPVRDPESLVQLFEIHPRIPPRAYFHYGLLRSLREHSSTLTGVIGQVEMAGPG